MSSVPNTTHKTILTKFNNMALIVFTAKNPIFLPQYPLVVPNKSEIIKNM